MGKKQRYLVLYDCTTRRVAFVWARSAAEIEERFRDLEVVEDRPSWLTGDELAKTEERMAFDVDSIRRRLDREISAAEYLRH